MSFSLKIRAASKHLTVLAKLNEFAVFQLPTIGVNASLKAVRHAVRIRPDLNRLQSKCLATI